MSWLEFALIRSCGNLKWRLAWPETKGLVDLFALHSSCYQMRIGYITYYNTPDNLRIALEDNLIDISAKNSETISYQYKHFLSNRPTMQHGLLWYAMYVSMMFTRMFLHKKIISFKLFVTWSSFPASRSQGKYQRQYGNLKRTFHAQLKMKIMLHKVK